MREGDEAFEALRQAIHSFGAERAQDLVAEARIEAAAKVRSMLAEAMAQSLLDHAREHLAAESVKPRRRAAEPRQPQRSSARRPQRAETEHRRAEEPRAARDEAPAYYVYGITRAGGPGLPDETPGVDAGHPAELVEHEELAAIVSRVTLAEFGEAQLHENLNDVGWLEDTARAHEEVLDKALSRMTVVPLRLCTIYRSEGQVQEMLSAERDVFADALRRLEGKTEWGVKLIAEPGAIERAAGIAAGAAGDEEAGASAGAAYMGQRRREAVLREAADAIAEDWAEAVHERMAAHASEALLNPLQNPDVSGHVGEMLLNGVYLVEDREADEFRHAVDELADEYRERGADVQLTGPWPPYNFVKSSIEAAR